MDYRKIYVRIVNKAKLENRKKGQGVYYELHHVLPKSLFPLWVKRNSNLVLLTAREHFFCHKLLVKIYPTKEMWCSLIFFLNNKKQGYCVIKGSREYERIKTNYLRERWSNEERKKAKETWTKEKKNEAHIRGIIQYYGSYDIYQKKLENKLKIIRQKTIDNIINDCRKEIIKQKAKEKREKRHIELLAIKQEHEQKRINGLLRGKKGFKQSEETKRKIGQANKKHWYTNGEDNIFSYECPDGFINGRILSEENKRKLREANKGRICSESTKQKLREFNKGKKLSEEHKQKLREAKRGKHWVIDKETDKRKWINR